MNFSKTKRNLADWTTALLLRSFMCATVILPAVPLSTALQDPPKPAELQLLDVEGYRKLLAERRDKAVLVNFWATWCEPCHTEYPIINDLAKQYLDKGLIVIGVNFDDDADLNLQRKFLARNRPVFDNFRMKPGLHVAFTRAVDANWRGSIPATFVYDRKGRVAARLIGVQERPQLERAIRLALESPAPAKAGP
jgi:thiol-disulfide isomerase/thioredoxin